MCGTALPYELVIIILFRYAGLQTRSAQLFRAGFAQAEEQLRHCYGPRCLAPGRIRNTIGLNHTCLCWAGRNRAGFLLATAHIDSQCPGAMPACVASHLTARRSSIPSQWLAHGGWEQASTIHASRKCARAHNWMAALRNRRGTYMLSGEEAQFFGDLSGRFREPTTEVAFLTFGHRDLVRAASIVHRGGVDTGVAPVESMSRAEWVREYCNGLRGEDRLKDWPRANGEARERAG